MSAFSIVGHAQIVLSFPRARQSLYVLSGVFVPSPA
jgi:hypothetical protein